MTIAMYVGRIDESVMMFHDMMESLEIEMRYKKIELNDCFEDMF